MVALLPRATWRDRRIEDLTRAEMMEAIHLLGAEVARLTTAGSLRARALGAAEMRRRGERP